MDTYIYYLPLSVITILSVCRQWIGHIELARRKWWMCTVWLCAIH